MALRAACKTSWLEQKYEKLLHTKEQTTSYCHVDTRLGQYYTYGALVQKYGGWSWPEGVAGATRRAGRCALLGGRWIRRDSAFPDLNCYLVLDVIHQGIFERKWQECARSFEEQNMNAAPPTKSGTRALPEK